MNELFYHASVRNGAYVSLFNLTESFCYQGVRYSSLRCLKVPGKGNGVAVIC